MAMVMQAPTDASLVVRVYRGIADHFAIRAPEWLMLVPAIGMWGALQIDPHMFSKSPSFADISLWITEGTLSFVFGLMVVCRLAALIINGTFKGFEFSPHIRAGASLMGVVIWSQMSLGFLTAFFFEGGAAAGFVMYGFPVAVELLNTWRSWLDVGKQF